MDRYVSESFQQKRTFPEAFWREHCAFSAVRVNFSHTTINQSINSDRKQVGCGRNMQQSKLVLLRKYRVSSATAFYMGWELNLAKTDINLVDMFVAFDI